MNRHSLALVAALSIAIPAAHANGEGTTSTVAEVHGVRLASICASCGVVAETRSESRNGQGSGLGAVGGAVAGGIVGHQIGHGSGNAAATVLGALGGGLAGNTIEKKVNKVTVWVTTVIFKDGSTQIYESTSDPALIAGDVVRIENGRPVRHASK